LRQAEVAPMFKGWPMKAREIVDKLCADPRFLDSIDGALFYLVRMPDRPQVRIGWPPKKGSKNVPMAILYLEDDGAVRLKVRVGEGSKLIGPGRPLYPSSEGPHHGNYLLTTPAIPDAVFDWLTEAAQFTRTKYRTRIAPP
jgi:hypothetical protein